MRGDFISNNFISVFGYRELSFIWNNIGLIKHNLYLILYFSSIGKSNIFQYNLHDCDYKKETLILSTLSYCENVLLYSGKYLYKL